MHRSWLDDHVGDEAAVRPEFEAELAERLRLQWRGSEVVPIRSAASRSARGRRRVPAWAAVLVLFVAGLGALVLTRPRVLPQGRVAPGPSVATSIPATSPAVPDSSLAPVTSTSGATTVPSSEPSTSELTTNVPTPPQPADLEIPMTGGDVLQPDFLGLVPFGSGPGELVLQNGEFPVPVAMLADRLLVIEDIPFEGLTGRVLELDRATGLWLRDLRIEPVDGRTPHWIEVSPNGTLFMVTLGQSDPGPATARLTAHRLQDSAYTLVESVDLGPVPLGSIDLTETGVTVAGREVLTIDTALEADGVTASVDDVDGASARVRITRHPQPSRSWLIDIAVDQDTPTQALSSRSGEFGDGAWFAGATSSDPLVDPDGFVALLSPDASPTWFTLGPWSIAAFDERQLVVAQVTTDGLVLATVTAPTASAPCTAEALLAAVVGLKPENERWRPVDVDVRACRLGYAQLFTVNDPTICPDGSVPCAESEQVFLQDVGGLWAVIDAGTGIVCTDPASLSPELVAACAALGLSFPDLPDRLTFVVEGVTITVDAPDGAVEDPRGDPVQPVWVPVSERWWLPECSCTIGFVIQTFVPPRYEPDVVETFDAASLTWKVYDPSHSGSAYLAAADTAHGLAIHVAGNGAPLDLLRSVARSVTVDGTRDAPTWDGHVEVDVATGAVTADGFNEYVDTRQPAAARTATSTALTLIGRVDARDPSLRIEETPDANGRFTVVVTESDLLDDSVYAVRYIFELQQMSDTLFRFVSGEWSQQCQPGRGHQDFAVGLCL